MLTHTDGGECMTKPVHFATIDGKNSGSFPTQKLALPIFGVTLHERLPVTVVTEFEGQSSHVVLADSKEGLKNPPEITPDRLRQYVQLLKDLPWEA
jgi:hypothetical protein